MRHLPVFLDVADRPCLVVGGGAVAARKAEALLRAGARVTLVAPLVGPEVESLARADGRLTLHRRPYEVADMAGCWLAYAATDDPAVQERVARDAERERVWLNAVDEPERCSFVMPAILERGRVTVAVGTGGASPLLAAAIRDEMALHVGPEHAAAADELAALRARFAPGAARRAAFASMLAAGLLEALRRGDAARVAEITREACAELEARADGPAGLP
ncbi:MAG TPA: bifunctional precorrin-2 dehydrogenase/sirohydrochlorin ferrochelatase [Candidatus Binatia bacterium]|nr:bifunctional precorrin-2 dehydrogenase/sirohydrochlorin ferrochelatase [Candidatus Binatia bacterium]